MMARPKTKRPMATIRQAVKLYIDGVKMDVIAEKFGVTQPTVSYWVKRHGKTMFGRKYTKSKRQRGRRMDLVPNERDAEIVRQVHVGIPAIRLAEQYGIKRQRASYIAKTWRERGYVPEHIFKTGQVVAFDGDPSRFVIQSIDGPTGTVLQTFNGSQRLDPAVKIENFKWFAAGRLCKVVDDTTKC